MPAGVLEKDVILRPEESRYDVWHNRDTKVAGAIDEEVMEHYGLFSPIREGEVYVRHRGNLVEMPNRKALIADLRHRDEIVPLHIASNNYEILQNLDVYQTMEMSLDEVGLPHQISCTGSLQNFSKFFISVELGDGDGFVVNGDKFHGFLNFLTSHDGSLSLKILDSLIRVVCANTFRYAVQLGGGNINFSVRHKKHAKQVAKQVAKQINTILSGRARVNETLEEFASISVAPSDIEKIVGGYFLKLNPDAAKDGFSTRTHNAIDEITRLAVHGRGNFGRNVYDVFNGATEYWTSGDGVGVSVDDGRKAFSSEFGTGATRKSEFLGYLADGSYNEFADRAADALAISN